MAGKLKLADVQRATLKRLLEDNGNFVVISALQKFGVVRVADLDPAQFPAFIAELEEK